MRCSTWHATPSLPLTAFMLFCMQLTAQLREAEAASEQQKALNQELSAVVQDLEDEQARTKAKLDKYRHR